MRDDTLGEFKVGRGTKKPASDKREKKQVAKLFKRVMHVVRNSAKTGKSKSKGKTQSRPIRSHYQRCAVRVSYSSNSVKGAWGAHGRYIERDGAQIENGIEELNNGARNTDGELGDSREYGADSPVYKRGGGDLDIVGFGRTINDMPSLSSIHVVREREGGAAQLLPSDALYDVDHFRKAQHGRLRRLLQGNTAFSQKAGARGRSGDRRGTGDSAISRRFRGNGLDSKIFGSVDASKSAKSILDGWQKSGDPRIFKFIISPEFGDKLNHKEHAEKLISKVQSETGYQLEWLGVTHWNTDHPHTHIVIRGVDKRGKEVRFDRDYIKNRFRENAGKLVTDQIGYRTEIDRIEAAMREVGAMRYTGLDMMLQRHAVASSVSDYATVTVPQGVLRNQYVQRLQTLEAMGLARRNGQGWQMRNDTRGVLKAMQITNDRMRSLRAGNVIASDERLPFVVTDMRSIRRLEGRILGHGQEDATGKSYMLLEGIDAKVHYIYHNRDVMQLRAGHQLKPGNYISIDRKFSQVEGKTKPETRVKDYGDAERLLKDKRYLSRFASKQKAGGAVYAGWLGRRVEAINHARSTPRKSLER